MTSPPASESQAPQRPSTGFSLYANLLDSNVGSSSASTIEKAPVVFKQGENGKDEGSTMTTGTTTSKISASTLRFQPVRRPATGVKATKAKIGIKPIGSILSSQSTTASQSQSADASQPAASTTTTSTTTTTAATSQTSSQAAAGARPVPVVKSTVEDWTNTGHSDDDVNGFYAHKQQEKERRKKRRRKNQEERREVDWDDIYDPERPNNYEEYKESAEKFREMEDWRNKLYGRKRAASEDSEASDASRIGLHNRGFAPPTSFGAVPPPAGMGGPPPPPAVPAPSEVVEAATGEDAYTRRMRLSQQSATPAVPKFHPPPPSFAPPSSFAPPTAFSSQRGEAPRTPPRKRSPEDDFHTGFSSPDEKSKPPFRQLIPPPPQAQQPTISAAPVLYSNPNQQPAAMARSRTPTPSPPPERTNRPGQKGFAARLMSKYGWTSGTGLGANATGIVKPLQAVASKAGDGRGKIIDANAKSQKMKAAATASTTSQGKFGKMSSVIELIGMLDNITPEDLESGELVQEIGQECSEKYGMVERVLIYPPVGSIGSGSSGGRDRKVFVKFTSEVSALRAVNALEGRLFNGSEIKARFFEVERWEAGELA